MVPVNDPIDCRRLRVGSQGDASLLTLAIGIMIRMLEYGNEDRQLDPIPDICYLTLSASHISFIKRFAWEENISFTSKR